MWNEKEISILETYYPQGGSELVCFRLKDSGFARSPKAIREKAIRLGVKVDPAQRKTIIFKHSPFLLLPSKNHRLGKVVEDFQGYFRIQTAEGMELYHNWYWESIHGPIPTGYYLVGSRAMNKYRTKTQIKKEIDAGIITLVDRGTLLNLFRKSDSSSKAKHKYWDRIHRERITKLELLLEEIKILRTERKMLTVIIEGAGNWHNEETQQIKNARSRLPEVIKQINRKVFDYQMLMPARNHELFSHLPRVA